MEDQLNELLEYLMKQRNSSIDPGKEEAYNDAWERLDKIVNPGAWQTSDFDETNTSTQ